MALQIDSKPARHLAITLAVSSLLLLIGALFNYWVDPAGLFLGNAVEEAIAEHIARGQPVAIYGNLNERYYQKRRLEMEWKKDADYLVLGSSRAMLMGEWITGGSTINAGVPGATLEDLFAMAAMTRDIHFKHIVIGVDPWIFNRNNNQQSWRALKSEYQAGLSLAGLAQEDLAASPSKNTKLLQLVNFEYLRESVKTAFAGKLNLRFEAISGDSVPDGAFLICQDGSRAPVGSCRDDLTSRVAARNRKLLPPALAEHKHVFGLRDFVTVDPQLFKKFTVLVNYLQRRGQVTLVLYPYRSDTWKLLSRIPAVSEAENQVKGFGAAGGLRVVGSFSPLASECGDYEFADYFHPNELCAARIWTAPSAPPRPAR